VSNKLVRLSSGSSRLK